MLRESPRSPKTKFLLTLVFTSDVVGVGVVSGVITAMESGSKKSERFHFFRLRLRLRRLRDLVKTRLSASEAEVEG